VAKYMGWSYAEVDALTTEELMEILAHAAMEAEEVGGRKPAKRTSEYTWRNPHYVPPKTR
jgi:hypothetical protein